jgi:hypothetical protein
MTPAEKSFLASLGTVDLLVDLPVQSPAVLHGFATSTPNPALLLHDVFVDYESHALGGLSEFRGEPRLLHSNKHPHLWTLETPGLDVLSIEGSVQVLDEQLLIDVSAGPVLLLLQDGAHKRAIVLTAQSVRMYAVSAPAAPLTLHIESVNLPTFLTVAATVGLTPVPEWMTEKESAASLGGLFHRCAAIGSAARLWSSFDAQRAGLDMLTMLSQNRSPLDRARQWFASLDASVHERLIAESMIEVDRLHTLLEWTHGDHASRPAAVDEAFRQWRERLAPIAVQYFERRDDLTSVAALLYGTALASALTDGLVALDEQARLELSTWEALAPLKPTAQLAASITEEPGQWWSALFE